ncbi:alpha/beta hydrolase [Corynebacterium frankenforstense]|uniref:alpha/beta hydrolase n=1 Tax=Corynebacterium frankenforstense TaxID=1230998 RepID=UPI001FEC0FEF|nr:alpha/beta hydrolase-fold protein [Corynebacterium frankenforstense]
MNTEKILNWPLLGGAAEVVVCICLALGVLLALVALATARARRGRQGHGPRRGRRLALALGSAAGVTVLVWLVLEVVWKPFGEPTSWIVYAVWGLVLLGLTALALAAGRRLPATVAVVVLVLGALGATNVVFQQYPTLRSLHPVPAAKEMDWAEFKATTQPPQEDGRDIGALVHVDLPSGTDFTARQALAYVPPAYWHSPQHRLPVLMLMAGNPGSPEQWFDSGTAGETADAWQAAHDGVSPIVVSVDGTGSLTGNPGCTGASREYVTDTAPDLIARRFRVDPDRSHWTIGGLSYGGTCALQVVTNSPDAFGSFLDFSGQAEPSLGDHARTVAELFGGDEAAFRAENPADLLKAKRYDGIAGRFVAGSSDHEATAALKDLSRAAEQAGMDVGYTEVPGGHDFGVWRAALRGNFDFVAQRGGLE